MKNKWFFKFIIFILNCFLSLLKFIWKIIYYFFNLYVNFFTKFFIWLYFSIFLGFYYGLKLKGAFFNDIEYGFDLFFCFVFRFFFGNNKLSSYRIAISKFSFFLTVILWFNFLLLLLSLFYCWCSVYLPVIVYNAEYYYYGADIVKHFKPPPTISPLNIYFILIKNIFYIFRHILVLIFEQLFYIYFNNRRSLFLFINVFYPSQFDFVW